MFGIVFWKFPENTPRDWVKVFFYLIHQKCNWKIWFVPPKLYNGLFLGEPFCFPILPEIFLGKPPQHKVWLNLSFGAFQRHVHPMATAHSQPWEKSSETCDIQTRKCVVKKPPKNSGMFGNQNLQKTLNPYLDGLVFLRIWKLKSFSCIFRFLGINIPFLSLCWWKDESNPSRCFRRCFEVM